MLGDRFRILSSLLFAGFITVQSVYCVGAEAQLARERSVSASGGDGGQACAHAMPGAAIETGSKSSLMLEGGVTKNLIGPGLKVKAVEKVDLGNFNLFNGNTKQAIRAYEHALSCDPDRWDAHFGLANCYFNKKDYQKAIQECRAVLKSKPNHKQTLLFLGNLLRAQGRPDEAAVHLQRCVALGMRTDAAYASLGLALAQNGDLAEAEKALAMVLKGKAKNPEAHLGKAVVLYKKGSHQEAVKELKTAISQRRGRMPEARNFRGDILYVLGRKEEAKKEYLEAIEKDDPLPGSFQALGNIYLDECNIDESLRIFSLGEKWYPGDSKIALGKAVALERKGRLADALRSYRKAIALYKDDTGARPWIDHLRQLSEIAYK